jgi:hypothetical protein
MTVAFIRPRAQLGMARWDATQSSEAESVHPAPASAATTRKSSLTHPESRAERRLHEAEKLPPVNHVRQRPGRQSKEKEGQGCDC